MIGSVAVVFNWKSVTQPGISFWGLATAAGTVALLLGDLNTTPYSPHFADLIQASRLRDTSRGFLLQGTWPAAIPPLRIPLDHCLASPEFHVSQRRIGPRIGSDHLPLNIELSLPQSVGP